MTIVLDGPKEARGASALEIQADEEARKELGKELYEQAVALHELVHKLHLMSLLAVCARLSRLASQPLVQAAVLSRLPDMQVLATAPETALGHLQSWFNETFIRIPSSATRLCDPDSTTAPAVAAIARGLSGAALTDIELNHISAAGVTSLEDAMNDATRKLLDSIELGQGTACDLTVIMIAACRALGINARLVSALNVTHLRPVGYAVARFKILSLISRRWFAKAGANTNSSKSAKAAIIQSAPDVS